jgi:hypothetical protein
MSTAQRGLAAALLCGAMGMIASPAQAQIDLSGGWLAIFHEDQPERIPGPALGDYQGLPINDSARAFAEAWDASRLTVPEHQCRAHSSPYILRGPLQLRIWEERNLQTEQIVAIHQSISNFQQHRVIWMDGRPHPSPYAEHTWMGFSTGRFEGDSLVVRTTHIKQMWHRRNGLPQSDRTVLTERYIRHGNILTHVSVTEDPDYLTEPLVKTTNMQIAPRELTPQQLIYPCESVVEIPDQPRGAVPHYLPGENRFLKDYYERSGIPEVAARGGAATMYPEFRTRLERGAGTPAPPTR